MEESVPEKRKNPAMRSMLLAAAFAVVLSIGFLGGIAVNAESATRFLSNVPLLGDGLDATPDPNADLTDFWKAWNALEERYVVTHASSTAPTTKEKIWGAIQGLAASYGDPYTVFMPPEEAKLFQDDIAGNFEGVGMEIGTDKDGILTVIAPLKGTPAEKAGIRAGDTIISIDGKSTEGLSSDEAVKKIRGPKGTVVTLMLLREGKTFEVKVTRDRINVPTIENSLDRKSGVYTIALYSFTENSAQLFDAALAEFRTSGSKKLIVDVRGDPGGYLDQAVAIASRFLPKGTMVVTEDYQGKGSNVEHRSSGKGGVPDDVKVAVLIDQGSASASEILAGALKDNNRATLIGTRSFGKGSVQELITIGEGSLKVTIARWLTPSGRSIMGNGVDPDISVERTAEDFTAGKDPQKDRAIQFLTTGK